MGLPKRWHTYQGSVNGRGKVLSWERLCSDLVLKEIRQNTKDGTSSKGKDEEKFALDRKEKKGKGNKFQSKPKSSQGGQNKYLSKLNASIVMNLGTMP